MAADRALLVIRQGERNKVLGLFPEQDKPARAMAALVPRIFSESQVLAWPAPGSESGSATVTVLAGISTRISGRPAAVIFELAVASSMSDEQVLRHIAQQALRRTEDIGQTTASTPAVDPGTATAIPKTVTAQVPAESLRESAGSEFSSEQRSIAEQGALIDAVAAVLDQAELDRALHALCNGIALHLRCQRISIGLPKRRALRVRAVSGVADLDARSGLMVDIAQAMEETRSAAVAIAVPPVAPAQEPPQHHVTLAEQLKHPALLSVPLVDAQRVVGVLLHERDRPFTARESAQVERLAMVLGPIVALKQLEAMGAGQWTVRHASRQLAVVFGRRLLGLKLGLLAVALLALGSSVHTEMFRVDADAAIEASVQRAVVASFPSFLSQVDTRAGDLVHRGDALAQLDADDLQLEHIKWQGELEKLAKEYRANLAQRDRSKMRVLDARRSQAQSQLDLLDAQIARSVLRAPIDGVVVSGDLSQALGRPVERGELLFEVASLEDFKLVLRLDEADIGWVQIGAKGQLRLRSLTDQTLPFTVSAITPVSEPGEGANVFRVEAAMADLPDSLRPGMAGVAKIDVEPRAIGWIWTRSFVQWARMQLWKLVGI
ncbi:MAG: HlyD family efflux transporter periplasmic adaptor subunit [Pseudomonadales bacterium]